MKVEEMLELFPEKECPNINNAIRKIHANLMFRSERAMVSISGGADSDMMLDMIQALGPEQNYPNDEIHYVWFNTGIEYTATKRHLDYLEAKYSLGTSRPEKRQSRVLAATSAATTTATWGNEINGTAPVSGTLRRKRL